jgi:hypothetical protein
VSPGAAKSATYSNIIRKYKRNDTRGLIGGKPGQRLGYLRLPRSPLSMTPSPRQPVRPQPVGRQVRMKQRNWQKASLHGPWGYRGFLLDAYSNVLAATPLVETKNEARKMIDRKIDALLDDWEEGR